MDNKIYIFRCLGKETTRKQRKKCVSRVWEERGESRGEQLHRKKVIHSLVVGRIVVECKCC